MSVSFSQDYMDREIKVYRYMVEYARRNDIGVIVADGRVTFTTKTINQMNVFARKTCEKFEFFEFW